MIAFIGYATFPLSPPRLLPPSANFTDTLRLYGPHYYGNANGESIFNAYGALPSLVNEYAAMPSMHVAWSFVAGALFGSAFRSRHLAIALGSVHSFFMGTAVILTGNHYVLDVVAGLLALGVAMATTASSLPVIGLRPWLETNT